MNGGYFIADCSGLVLSTSAEQTITGIWSKAVQALKTNKPIIANGCVYGNKPVTAVTCFGWQIADDEIVIVGATLHIHIKDNDKVTVLDVASNTTNTKKGGK